MQHRFLPDQTKGILDCKSGRNLLLFLSSFYCRLMGMIQYFLYYNCELDYLLCFSSVLIHGVLKLMLILQGLKLVLFRRVENFLLLEMN